LFHGVDAFQFAEIQAEALCRRSRNSCMSGHTGQCNPGVGAP
jgi:hypothetical protein